ncbi:MAG TPA: DUF2723 domain-containing protein [Gemmatimonadales bacterium]|nr:DUF2723 domain-containing protein [Gemmatimonadales bacterium]
MTAPYAPTTERPPYRAALVVTLLVLAGYALSLAPTVTFWDAGELIATMKILGIPHPPGTPLFVMIGHVWGALLPFVGEFAARTNLLSATCSALSAGAFFLVAHECLGPATAGLEAGAARLLRIGGGAAAAIAAAFTFTNWQNSNETEVYAVAQLLIALVCWLCLVWRRRRAEPAAARVLLLVVYLLGLAVANHLLALLVGPAVIVFLAATLHAAPAADARVRRREWAQAAVVAGTWALLIGTGLGSGTLTLLGGLCFLAAAAFAATAGALAFALTALAVAAVGVTPYLFLYIRAGQHPIVNEAQPDTWPALLDVIRRAQYPVRTPLDDPTVPHGPDNPGRTLTIFWLQLQNYLLYFDWQWAKGLGLRLATPAGELWARTLVTIAFLWLGIRGALAQRRADRPAWWLLLTLFLVTGLGLVVYMNFKPGASQGYDLYPSPADHEVRERDYFFVVSFVVWGLWAGMGLADAGRALLARPGGAGRDGARRALAGAVLAAGLVPLALNWRAATRRQTPAASLPADVAWNLLQTVPPYGILITYGDNDTFPLWWAQEVAGIRRDVTVLCLALGNTDWYMRQLRDQPVRDFDEAAAPAVWRGLHPAKPTWPLHTMRDEEIQQAMYLQRLPRDIAVPVGPLQARLPAGTVLGPNDILTLRVLQQNAGRRPVVWSVTAGRNFAGLDGHVVQQALGYRLETTPIDTTSPRYDLRRLAGAPLDVPLTVRLAWETYRYGELPGADLSRLETTDASFAATLSLPFTQLAYAYQTRGEPQQMARNLERATELSTNPALRAALDEMRRQALGAPPDTSPNRAVPR